MESERDNPRRNNGRQRMVIAALALLTLTGIGTAVYFGSENAALGRSADEAKLTSERLLGEKLQLEKQIAELGGRLSTKSEALTESERKEEDLKRRVEQALARAKGLEGSARKSKDLERQVAELRKTKEQLELTLATNASLEHDLRDQLERTAKERDEFATELAEHKAGAQMVNNAEVDALRGKKGKLTVMARRAKEIRMAFDLPGSMAQGASFKIIAPDGHNYSGADPAISMSLETMEPEPFAAVDLMPEALSDTDRAARVHLKFTPTEKLQPGTYRIDVMAGGEYLNTVLLNLR